MSAYFRRGRHRSGSVRVFLVGATAVLVGATSISPTWHGAL